MRRGGWLLVCVAALFVATPAYAATGAAATAQLAPHTAHNTAHSRGALVVAKSEAARPFAKSLARLIYRDAALRPTIDEKMARVLMGDDPDAATPADQRDAAAAARADVLATVHALGGADESVGRRLLLSSTAKDLGAELVVLVEADPQGEPKARVLKVSNGRYVGVTLAAERLAPETEGGPARWDWSDALPILRGLRHRPPPGPRAPVPVPASAPPVSSNAKPGQDGDEGGDLLTSPWFWSGLGIVVTVGVTVLVLSQTAFKNKDVVNLQGRVSP